MAVPATRYAKSGDVHIAYQVFGSGATDLVVPPVVLSLAIASWYGPPSNRGIRI
jgi:hypothetical protein